MKSTVFLYSADYSSFVGRGVMAEEKSMDDKKLHEKNQEDLKDILHSLGEINNGTDENFDAVEISEDTHADFNILGIFGGNVKSNKSTTKVKEKESEITNMAPELIKELNKAKHSTDMATEQNIQNNSENDTNTEVNVTNEEVLNGIVDILGKDKNETDNNYDAVEISEDTDVGFDILGILGKAPQCTKIQFRTIRLF